MNNLKQDYIISQNIKIMNYRSKKVTIERLKEILVLKTKNLIIKSWKIEKLEKKLEKKKKRKKEKKKKRKEKRKKK